MDRELIAKAEEAVARKAAEIAYKYTEIYSDPEIQRMLNNIYRDFIILGARLMQEELIKPKNNIYES